MKVKNITIFMGRISMLIVISRPIKIIPPFPLKNSFPIAIYNRLLFTFTLYDVIMY